MTPQLIVPLDVGSLDDALRLRDELSEVNDFFKVGKELFTAVGPRILRELSEQRVFLDLKFHDIPNTVAGAVAAAAGHDVDIVDVHASGGVAMMKAAALSARHAVTPPIVLGVTVLTSLSDDDLTELGMQPPARQQVVRLSKLALASGLDGVVASPQEIESVQEATQGKLKLLVPGVRPDWAPGRNDQKRVATPREVAAAGASYVVVGRAISEQQHPKDAAMRILDELASA